MWKKQFLVLLVLLSQEGLVPANPPAASYIFPAGGQRGKSVQVRVGGLFLTKRCSFEVLGPGVTTKDRLQPTRTVWFEGPLLPLPESQQAEDYPKDMAGQVDIAPDAPPGIRYWRLWNAQGGTSAKKFMVGELPEIVENEIEGAPIPVEVRLPVTINGRIFPRENVDVWSFEARKGQTVTGEVCAARLGSPLDSRLEVRDSQGRPIVENDDTFGADSFVRFTAPRDGKYEVRIHDISFRGGPAYVYRLTLRTAPAEVQPSPRAVRGPERGSTKPDFRLRLGSDVLAIHRGGQGKLKVQVERLGGFSAPIALSVSGLPTSISAMPVSLSAAQKEAEIAFKVEPAALFRGSRLTVRGLATDGKEQLARTATWTAEPGQPEVDRVLLVVTLPTPFKIVGQYDMGLAPRGTVYHRRYHIDRGGFPGPIEVSVADRQARHLQGVTGPAVLVPPGVVDFDFAVHLPPWMETGRTCRVCVMGVGAVRDRDGSEHFLSFCSTEQNEQMVAVVEPGRLGVEVDRPSLLAEPGKAVSLGVRVMRDGALSGPVKLELALPTHVRGIVSKPVLIPARKADASFPIWFDKDRLGPFNAPLVLRATLLVNGEPVFAETKLEIVSALGDSWPR
jgi:hypothetical protein